MTERGVLNKADVPRLADAVMEVLERVGVLCQNDEILAALADAGAQVDRQRQLVRFPRALVERYADEWRREAQAGQGREPELFSQFGRAQSEDERSAAQQAHSGWFKPAALPVFGTQVAQFVYDDETGERRPGNCRDFIRLIQLADVLHPEMPAGHSLLLEDVPPLLEPLEAALLLAEYAHRPGPAFAWNVRQIDYLSEMGEMLGIPDWFDWGAICFAHPLRFDKDVADKLVQRVRSGEPTGLTSMAIAGVSAPVTVAGFVVVAAAEFIATWIAARTINPAVPLGGSMWGGAVDMRTGAVSYCSPDAMVRAFATVEFLEHWCGTRVAVGGGEYCDAREPGWYATLEKAYKAMTIAAFTGQYPMLGQGMLECGKTISAAQLLIERDWAAGTNLLGAPIEVTPETIALDAILEVGIGLEHNHLETEHTLRHFRRTLWAPALFDRSGWNGPASDEALLSRARARVEELLASYRKPDVDPDVLAHMRQVVERARGELLDQ